MSKISVKDRWSLYQYDLYEIFDGKTIEECIGWLMAMKMVCQGTEGKTVDGHKDTIVSINIREDGHGGLLTDLELYGDISYRDESGRLIPHPSHK